MREVSVQLKTLESSERGNLRELLMRIRLTLAVVWTLVILVLCWTPADWLPVKETGGRAGTCRIKTSLFMRECFWSSPYSGWKRRGESQAGLSNT